MHEDEYFGIAFAAAEERLCLFTGTGFSKAISNEDNNAPSWWKLIEKVYDKFIREENLKKELFPCEQKDKGSSLRPDEAAQIIDEKLSRKKEKKSIHREIAEIIKDVKLSEKHISLSEEHISPVKKFFQSCKFEVVTTNYDKLAEDLAGEDCQSLSPGLPIFRSDNRVKVFHVHGSVDFPPEMVVTTNDYHAFMSNQSYFSRKLSTILHENTLVILGYSFDDMNLKSIFSEYHTFARSREVSKIFLVSHSHVNNSVMRYYDICYGIRVIQCTEVENFFSKVNENIEKANEFKKIINQPTEINHEILNKDFIREGDSFHCFFSKIRNEHLADDNVIKTIKHFLKLKKELTNDSSPWKHYEHLASWLVHIGSRFKVKGTDLEGSYQEYAKYSMKKMGKGLGYSWYAYGVWEKGWRTLKLENRSFLAEFIKDDKELKKNQDALSLLG